MIVSLILIKKIREAFDVLGYAIVSRSVIVSPISIIPERNTERSARASVGVELSKDQTMEFVQ
jgi:hypothetical protein